MAKPAPESQQQTETTHFDAIIIGSGMGGQTAASILAKVHGKHVLVLEQHYSFGGLTHEFSRRGFRFETGLHYVGGMVPGSPPRNLMDFLSGGEIDWHPLPDPYDIFCLPGQERFGVPFGEENFRQKLQQRFPREAQAIAQYFQDLKLASSWMGTQMMRKSLPNWLDTAAGWFVPDNENLARQTLENYLDGHFSDPELKMLLAVRWGDYGQPPAEASFGMHATVEHSYMNGAWFPAGGPSALAEAVKTELERHGTTCLLRHRVKEISLKDGKAVGVVAEELRKGEPFAEKKFTAPIIISAAGARQTYLKFLPQEIAEPYRQAIENFPAGTSGVMVFLGLDGFPAQLELGGENYWIYAEAEMQLFNNHRAVADRIVAGSPPMSFASFGSLKNSATNHPTIEMLCPVRSKAFTAALEAAGKEQMPKEDLKAELAAGFIRLLERELPGLREHIVFQEVATPSTFSRFTGRPYGEFYGPAADPEREDQEWLDVETPVKGLYLTGSDVASLGIMGAAMGGVFTAGRIAGLWGLPGMMKNIFSPQEQ